MSENEIEVDVMPWEDDPFEKREGARAVMEMMDVTGRAGEYALITLRVMELTAESKVKPADYEGARVYQRFDGNGFLVHIPIYDPEQLIDDTTGNVGVLAHVHKVLARQLDGVAVAIANERLDRRIAAADRERAVKEARFDVGTVRREVQQTSETETL